MRRACMSTGNNARVLTAQTLRRSVLAFLDVNAFEGLQIAFGRFDQPVIFVHAGEAVHDGPLFLTRFAVPESHAVSELVRHEATHSSRIGCGNVQIYPGGLQYADRKS